MAMARAKAARLRHASAELRRAVVLEAAEPHLFELDAHHHLDGGGLQVGVFEQGQRDVFAHRQGADQRAALKGQADFLADGVQLAFGGARQIHALE